MRFKVSLKSKAFRAFLIAAAPVSLVATGCVYTQAARSENDVIEESGGRLNFEQARQRIRDGEQRQRQGFRNYLETRQNAARYYQKCIQADYTRDQVPTDGALPLWNAVQTVRNGHGLIVQGIYPQSVSSAHFLCFAKMSPNVLGTWQLHSRDGIVRFQCRDENNVWPFIFTTYVHETVHSIQDDLGVYRYDYSWRLQDRQMALLGIEAGARVAAYLAAFELSLENNDVSWERNAGRHISTLIKETYHQYRADGLDHREALERTGTAAWQEYFNGTPWLDQHNITFIHNILDDFHHRRFKPLRDSAYTLERARLTGYITSDLNVTRYLDRLPTRAELHGDNPKIRRILEFLELEQLRQVYGTTHQEYQELLTAARRDNNPYLDVNLDNIRQRNGAPDIMVQFDIEAGLVQAPAPAAQGGNPATPSPNVNGHTHGRPHCLS